MRGRRLFNQALQSAPNLLSGSARVSESSRSKRGDLAIFALAKLAESRDTETGQHIERVQWYSRILAQRLAEQPKVQTEIDGEFISLIFSTSRCMTSAKCNPR